MIEEAVWDKYWKKFEYLDVENVIEEDTYYRLLKRLVKLPHRKGMRILEVGCGSGIRTLALLRNFKNHFSSAVLVDLSLSALLFAKRNANKNKIKANFILSDAFNLPFLDETFDVVWNEGVNEHFIGEKRQKVFEEMSRACKERGQVIVIVPNALNVPYRITKRALEKRGKWIYGFEKPYTICELEERMRRAGITRLKKKRY